MTPSNLEREEALAGWLLAHDQGLNPDEQAAFSAWLDASPANAAAWAKAEALWAQFDEPPDPLLSTLLLTARTASPPIWNGPRLAIAAAAVIAVLLGGGLTWRALDLAHRPASSELAQAEGQLYVASAAPRSVTLTDGTRVRLDASATLNARIQRHRRDVALTRGRAFFEVAHDAARPFVVTAGDHTVTATGTAFEVSMRSGGLQVVLAEGHVTVAQTGEKGGEIRLQPGERFVATAGQPARVSRVDATELAWRSGFVEFKATRLSEAVAEMTRHGKTTLVIDDPKAAGLHITGRYRADDPEGFAATLVEIYPVRLRRDAEGRLHIRSR